MTYRIKSSYTSWQGELMASERVFEDARSASLYLTHLGRDGVRDITIIGPDGVAVDLFYVIGEAAAEDRVQQENGPHT